MLLYQSHARLPTQDRPNNSARVSGTINAHCNGPMGEPKTSEDIQDFTWTLIINFPLGRLRGSEDLLAVSRRPTNFLISSHDFLLIPLDQSSLLLNVCVSHCFPLPSPYLVACLSPCPPCPPQPSPCPSFNSTMHTLVKLKSLQFNCPLK